MTRGERSASVTTGPWPLVLPAAAVGTAPDFAAVDVLSPGEVLGLYCRHADELARVVESALAGEDAEHREQLRVLDERHRRRTAVLRMLADALGEKNAQLDEVAHHLGAVEGGAG